MSNKNDDRQFLLICFLAMWTGVRIIATIIGVWPWSEWIVTAMLATALALVMWMSRMEEA